MNYGKGLVFSMGFNHYDALYARLIETHREYAVKFQLQYVFVGNPELTPLLMECAWLKIPLILSAIASGWDWVLYLDADAELKPVAPDFRSVAMDGKDLYMGKGFSGRVNSGVMIIRNTEAVAALFRTILDNAGMELPGEDVVGWGENGEVIHFTKHYPGLSILDTRWNNNSSPELDDYIRHYSAGIMRSRFELTDAEKQISEAAQRYNRAVPAGNKPGSEAFYADLEKLFSTVTLKLDEFAGLDGKIFGRNF